LLETKEYIEIAVRAAIIAIPVFYVYHWLAALYEIYDAERLATWERLKE